MKKTILILIVITAVAVWWFLRYGENDRRDPVNTHLPDKIDTIVLISIDTIRADHLSCYGYEHRTTPNIDALVTESMVFEHAFADVPLTLPSHCSMLTGQSPPSHGVHDNFKMALPLAATTLPEVLKENGYATYGIISAIVLDHIYGLNQGFDTYDDVFETEVTSSNITERNGKETTAHAIKWLKEHAHEKKFMFLHYYDPHRLYAPPAPFDKEFEHPYDGEIAFTDHCIGRFIDELKSLKLYEDALIVIVGDHGEMLGEHGENAHSYYIYQSAIKVPLIIKFPQASIVKRVPEPCGLIDVPTTILLLADIKIPETMTGVDLSQYRNDAYTLSERKLFSESLTPTKYNGNSLLSIIKGPWHYIQTTRPELYNRLTDPKEQVNLIKAKPHLARLLQNDLAEFLKSTIKYDQETAVQTDQKTIELLESLGYVGGTVDTDFSFNTEKTDPKDLIDIHKVFGRVVSLVHAKQFTEGIALLEQIIRSHPDIPESYGRLANIYDRMNKWNRAIEFTQKKLTLLPEDLDTLKILADFYNKNKQYQEAIDTLNTIIKSEPDNADSWHQVSQNYFLLGDSDNALKYFLKAVELFPDNIDRLKALAYLYNNDKQYQEAIDTLNKIIKIEPDDAFAWQQLSQNYLLLEEADNALKYCLKAVELFPDNIDTLKILADLYNKNKQYQEAIDTINKIIKIEPDDAAAWCQLGKNYLLLEDSDSALKYLLKALEVNGKHVPAHIIIADTYLTLGKYKEAITHFEIAFTHNENLLTSLNTVAHLQASHKDPEIFSPVTALKYAEQAAGLIDKTPTNKENEAQVLDTLAIALAANGNFKEAIETATKACDLSIKQGQPAFAKWIQNRIKLYEEKKAYRE